MDEPPTPISPEIREQINAIRNDATHSFNNPLDRGHEAAVAKLEELYRAGTGEKPSTPDPGDEASATTDAAPPLLELPPAPEGHHYDAGAVTELFDFASVQGIDQAAIRAWMTAGHDVLTQGVQLGPEAADAALAARFGDRADAVIADARYFLHALPAQTRVKVEAWLEETGMGDNVDLIAWAAGHGVRLYRNGIKEPATTRAAESAGDAVPGSPQFERPLPRHVRGTSAFMAPGPPDAHDPHLPERSLAMAQDDSDSEPAGITALLRRIGEKRAAFEDLLDHVAAVSNEEGHKLLTEHGIPEHAAPAVLKLAKLRGRSTSGVFDPLWGPERPGAVKPFLGSPKEGRPG